MHSTYMFNSLAKFIIPPFYLLFSEFKSDADGWLIWPPRLLAAKQSLKFDDYVNLYNDERLIKDYFMSLMTEIKGFSDTEKLNDQHFQALIQGMIQKYEGNFIDGFCADLDVADLRAQATLEVLGFENQLEESKHEAAFLSFIIAYIFNLFSIMVHGQKLTSLVSRAIQGDDNSFIRAIKIDRNLLTAHPYFSSRFELAQSTGEVTFIKKVSRTISTPHLKGKIKNSSLYFIFSLLDTLKLSDQFTHSEILDLYNSVSTRSSDREIYDTSSISKHLKTYRKLQD